MSTSLPKGLERLYRATASAWSPMSQSSSDLLATNTEQEHGPYPRQKREAVEQTPASIPRSPRRKKRPRLGLPRGPEDHDLVPCPLPQSRPATGDPPPMSTSTTAMVNHRQPSEITTDTATSDWSLGGPPLRSLRVYPATRSAGGKMSPTLPERAELPRSTPEQHQDRLASNTSNEGEIDITDRPRDITRTATRERIASPSIPGTGPSRTQDDQRLISESDFTDFSHRGDQEEPGEGSSIAFEDTTLDTSGDTGVAQEPSPIARDLRASSMALETVEELTDTSSPLTRASSDDPDDDESSTTTGVPDPDDDVTGETQFPDLGASSRTLFTLLAGGSGKCSAADHAEADIRHELECVNNHHDLSTTYKAWIESKGPRNGEIGLDCDSFPSNKGRRRADFTAAHALRSVFEGAADPGQPIRNVCLHKERSYAEPAVPISKYDVDSVQVRLRSLGAIRKGMEWCPSRLLSYNITKDIHMYARVTYDDDDGHERTRTVAYKDIPHMYLGTVDGLPHSALLVFFPGLYKPEKQFVSLSDKDLSDFFSHAWSPALFHELGRGSLPQLPPSHLVAELNSRAGADERASGPERRGTKRYPHYPLPGDVLGSVWDEVTSNIWDPRNNITRFDSAFLFLNVKGVKSRYSHEGSLYEALSDFQSDLESALHIADETLVESVYIDIGREYCGPFSRSLYGELVDGGDPTVYLWKDCCLQTMLRELQQGPFGGMKGRSKLYNVGFLRDATCLTVEPPRTSQIYRDGFTYLQAYNPVKGVLSTLTVGPFQDERIDDLAIDPAVLAALISAAKLSNVKSRDALVDSITASKRRVRSALLDARKMSFPTRLEVRVAWRLCRAIQERARRYERHHPMAYRLTSHPRSAWVVETQAFTTFLRENYDKLISLAEMAIITSPEQGVTLDRTRLIHLVFRCLRGFFNIHLNEHKALAITREESQEQAGQTVRGLGIRDNMARYGFGWFTSIVDWDCLRFHDDIATSVLGIQRRLVRWFDRYHTQQIFDRSSDLNTLVSWLPHIPDTRRQAELLRTISHLMCQQYRRDTLSHLNKELVLNSSIGEDVDKVLFCLDHFTQFIDKPIHQISGNKTKFKTPQDVFDWLWGPSEADLPNPAYRRDHFDQKPFRIWYHRALGSLQPYPFLTQSLTDTLFHEFYKYHWLIPYPDGNGTLISTQYGGRGARQFYATSWGFRRPGKKGLKTKTTTKHLSPPSRSREWIWIQGQQRHGLPDPYPAQLTMSLSDLYTIYRPRTA